MASEGGIALVDLDEQGVDRAFRADVLDGLGYDQKAIPARWLYDEAGSQLFEDITQIPEYYPTRAETEILTRRGAEFAEAIGKDRAVVEFGSGSSVKTPLLLNAINPAAYVPLDISGDFLRQAADDLSAKFPGLPVYPIEADFMREVDLPRAVHSLPKLGFFPGSTIGNMVPRTAVDLLRSMRATLQADHGVQPMLLIGMDLVKDPDVLEAAYDDAGGVTAEFNLNLLDRMNQELDADFDRNAFHHRSVWNEELARIEMHLVSQKDQTVTIAGTPYSFAEGETIHTENSHKYSVDGFDEMGQAAGWRLDTYWTDPKDLFGVFLLRS